MKKLTQSVFDLPECPDWADSLAVDANGDLYAFNCHKEFLNSICNIHQGIIGSYWELVGSGYDTTNWQQSAIDRGEK